MSHTALEGTTLGMYSQCTGGPELYFLQVVNQVHYFPPGFKLMENILHVFFFV